MSEQVDFVIADLDRFTQREIISLALNIDANLRESPPVGTPIDTGWARANWVPSVGDPAILPASNNDPDAAAIAARQQAAENGLNRVLQWSKDDGPIYITNNVPYIGALNNGHSPQQAQPGFVQRAIEKAVKETYSAGAARAARNRRASAFKSSRRRPL